MGLDLQKSSALAVLPCGLHMQSPFQGKGTRSRLLYKNLKAFFPSSFHKTEGKKAAVQPKISQTMSCWSFWKPGLLGPFTFSPLSYYVTLGKAQQLVF